MYNIALVNISPRQVTWIIYALSFDGLNNEHGVSVASVGDGCGNIKGFAGLFKAASVLQVSIDQFQVLSVIHLEPHGNGLGREASVRLTDDDFASLFQDPVDLLQNLDWFNQIVNRHDTGHNVERIIRVGQGWVDIQILLFKAASELIIEL